MAYYPHITILPFSSMQSMMSALANPRHNGKVWQAKLWGNGNDLKKISEKEPMLYDWIFLTKILKTLENYAKENGYNAFSSRLNYTVSLVTDCTGSIVDNTTFIIECLASNSVKVHSNYTYSDYTGNRIKLQDIEMIAGPLEKMSGDVQTMVEDIVDTFFYINESNTFFCPPPRLQKIYANCLSLATTI